MSCLFCTWRSLGGKKGRGKSELFIMLSPREGLLPFTVRVKRGGGKEKGCPHNSTSPRGRTTRPRIQLPLHYSTWRGKKKKSAGIPSLQKKGRENESGCFCWPEKKKGNRGETVVVAMEPERGERKGKSSHTDPGHPQGKKREVTALLGRERGRKRKEGYDLLKCPIQDRTGGEKKKGGRGHHRPFLSISFLLPE